MTTHGFRAYRPHSNLRRHEQITLSISPGLSLRLSAAATQALGSATDHVTLGYDPETQTIAITPTHDQDPYRLKLVREERKSGLQPAHISAIGFCQDLHLGPTDAGPVPGEVRDGALYFSLRSARHLGPTPLASSSPPTRAAGGEGR